MVSNSLEFISLLETQIVFVGGTIADCYKVVNLQISSHYDMVQLNDCEFDGE